MNLDAETMLALVIWAFYIQDSVLLLHFDDLLVSGGRRGWRAWTGSDLEMRGRFLFVPAPFLPALTIYRASWLTPETGAVDNPNALLKFSRLLWPLRVGCSLVGVSLLIVVPWIMLTSGDAVLLLVALCISTAVTLLMLTHLLANRRRLDLGVRALAVMTVESLLCPPYAINLYRKMCIRRGFRGDPVIFAAKAMDTNAQRELYEAIQKRLDLLLLASEGISSEVEQLHAAHSRIKTTLLP